VKENRANEEQRVSEFIRRKMRFENSNSFPKSPEFVKLSENRRVFRIEQN